MRVLSLLASAAAGPQLDHRIAGLHAEKGERFGGMPIGVARDVRGGAGGRGDRGGDRIAALRGGMTGMAIMLHCGGGNGDQGGGTCNR